MKQKAITKSFSIIKESIHRIDPYSLISSGSPDDEFDSEINSIIKQLDRCNSGKDVGHAISRVLNSSFSENFSPDSFEKEGNIIYKKLVSIGVK